MKIQLYNLFIVLAFIACGTGPSANTLSPAEFKSSMDNTPSKLLLDVRTPEEFMIDHLEGATNLNYYDSNFKSNLEGLDKESPIFVYCKSGNRSSKAVAILQDLGFKSIYELDGGIQNWKSQNLSMVEAVTKPTAAQYSLAQYNAIIDSTQLVLVDFMAEWCGPCKRMAPSIENLKNKYSEQLTILQIDVDQNTEIAEHFKINGIPALKIYSGGVLKFDEVSYKTEAELEEALGPYL